MSLSGQFLRVRFADWQAKAGVMSVQGEVFLLETMAKNPLSTEELHAVCGRYRALPKNQINWKLAEIDAAEMTAKGEALRVTLQTALNKSGSNALPLPKIFQG